MKYCDGENTYHSHPTIRVVVTEDNRVLRIARACLVPVGIVMTGNGGRCGKPYPAANVEKASKGEWTFKTLSRLVIEARTGVVLLRKIHAHHPPGRAKSEYAYGATKPVLGGKHIGDHNRERARKAQEATI